MEYNSRITQLTNICAVNIKNHSTVERKAFPSLLIKYIKTLINLK